MPRSFMQTAEARIGRQQYAEALRVLKRGLSSMPEGWSPFVRSDDLLRAAFWSVDEFNEYIKQDQSGESVFWTGPSYSKAWYWVAHCEWELGRRDEAERAIEQALRLEPDHPEILCEVGFHRQQKEQWPESLEAYRAALRGRSWATPDQRGLALRGQGYCLIELWDFEEAAHVLLESLRAEPGNHVAMGELAYLQKTREEADGHKNLDPGQRAALYPPAAPEMREMIAFAASVPAARAQGVLGRHGFQRIRKAFEQMGWLGFQAEFISLYPQESEETRRLKALALRDPLFHTAYRIPLDGLEDPRGAHRSPRSGYDSKDFVQ